MAALEDVLTADPQSMGQPEQALEMQGVYATIAGLGEDFRLALVAWTCSASPTGSRPGAGRAGGDAHYEAVRTRKQVTKLLIPEPAPAVKTQENGRGRERDTARRSLA